MLCLNASKSELILLGSRQQIAKLPNFRVRVNDIFLCRKDAVRDLGIMFDERVNFEGHVLTVCRNALFYLRTIARIRRAINTMHCKMLIHALVLSRIDYGCALFIGINNKLLTKLQRVVEGATRLTLLSRSCKMQDNTKWLNSNQRIQFRVLTIVREALHGRSPVFIADMFQFQDSGRLLRLNSQCLLEVQWMRTEMGRNAFGVAASRLWNTIPLGIRQAGSSGSFRSQLENHLLSQLER
jgi:hypothetical protein